MDTGEHGRPLCKATGRDGRRCTHFAVIGGNLCRWHGGKHPKSHVKLPLPEPGFKWVQVPEESNPPIISPRLTRKFSWVRDRSPTDG